MAADQYSTGNLLFRKKTTKSVQYIIDKISSHQQQRITKSKRNGKTTHIYNAFLLKRWSKLA
jgi:hypothetical protein